MMSYIQHQLKAAYGLKEVWVPERLEGKPVNEAADGGK